MCLECVIPEDAGVQVVQGVLSSGTVRIDFSQFLAWRLVCLFSGMLGLSVVYSLTWIVLS